MNKERGSSLVLALFATAMLTGMGLALLLLSQGEMEMNQGDLRAKRTFFISEAGLEAARMSLFAAENGGWTDDLQAVAGANGTVDFDPSLIEAVVTDVNGAVTGLTFSTTIDDTPLSGPTRFASADPPGWYLTYLTNDPADSGGIQSATDTNERVMLTGVGVGSNNSMEIVQAIVEPFQFLPPVPRAAISLLGETAPSFDNGNSNAQTHSGDDCGVAGGAYVPIVGSVTPGGKTQIQSDMNRPNNFTSGPYTGQDTIGNLTDPTDPVVGGTTLAPLWTDCPAIKQLVLDLISRADYYCNTDSSSCAPPAMAAGQITVIDGDFTTNRDSAGVLLVTGRLTYRGNREWRGIVLVLGEGRMLRNGGGNGQPQGAVVVANIDPSTGGPYADKSDWCSGGGTDGFGQAEYDTNGGGNSDVMYCSTFVDASNPVSTYQVTEFLQR